MDYETFKQEMTEDLKQRLYDLKSRHFIPRIMLGQEFP